MAEYDNTSTTYLNLGAPGTPARDAALPKFIDDTKNWVTRVEAIKDDHPAAQPRLSRTLQRHLDDLWLLASNIAPGQEKSYDKAAWTDSLVAYGGPQSICNELGAGW
jgi:hypothetical protein